MNKSVNKINKSVKVLAINAMLAALYVALAFVLSPISYGAIQVRLATSLYQLVAVDKRYYPGMVVGVVIANLFSPYGFVDIFAGLGVTGLGLAVAIILIKNVKKRILKHIITTICVTIPMIFVAVVLKTAGGVPVPYPILYMYLMIGQLIAQTIGAVAVTQLGKVVDFKAILN